VHTSGPRRYSKLDLCTTRQLEHLAEEFCYDLDTLRNIASALGTRTCRHSAQAKRVVDRQIKALMSRPPPKGERVRTSGRWLGVAAIIAVLLAMVIDEVGQWFALS
jgi:hypothetical protein